MVVDGDCSLVPERFRLRAPVSYRRYLQLMASSLLVFNSPAVHGCLGWKLGEFLALGVPILSMPLGRELAVPLTHGVNIHFVTGGLSSLVDEVQYIATNERYRQVLSDGAREYFDAYVRPEAMMAMVLNG
jgi:glycosyltransferase involved in cell wall biosynthesis